MNANTTRHVLFSAAAGLAVGMTAWVSFGLGTSRAVFSPTYAAIFLLAPAVLCALGRWLTGHSLGIVAGMVLGFLAGTIVPGEPTMTRKGRHVGQIARIDGPTLDGGSIDVASLKGKVILVDFWATRCAPCRQEMPRLARLHRELEGEGLVIVGVSADVHRPTLENFVRSANLHWPQIFYPEQETGAPSPLAVRYEVGAIPHLMVIDRDGRIASNGLNAAEAEAVARHLLRDGGPMEAPPVSSASWALAAFGALIGGLLQGGLGKGKGAPS